MQRMCRNHYFIVLFDKQCFEKNKLGPVKTYLKTPPQPLYLYLAGLRENDQKRGCEGAREELRGSLKRTVEAKTLQK